MRSGIVGGPGTSDLDRITYANLSLQRLLLTAYEIAPFQLTAPPGLDSDSARFTIEAKIPEGSTKGAVNQMLQNLLADRFKVTLHRETKNGPVYELVVVKKGPMLREPAAAVAPGTPFTWKQDKDGYMQPPGGSEGTMDLPESGGWRIVGSRQTTSDLATTLSLRLKRPVLDKTGLTDKYDYNLTYSTGQGAAGQPGVASDPAPDLIAAVRDQLGLKLESKTGSIEMLVIDHIEKVPTAN